MVNASGPVPPVVKRSVLHALWAGVLFLSAAHGQVTVTTDFKDTTADGWIFGGSTTSTAPYLTANTVDSPGDGWLRLTESLNNQSTYAFFDSEIFSVNAQIQIEMEYSFWNGSGADGITFFLVDGGITADTFRAGAFGGSLGYAQKDAAAAPPSGEAGMAGGYLGIGFDNFGNYSNPTEGRVGGTGSVPNAIAVRGPESSDYAFIAGSGPLQNLSGGGQMDFPTYTTRPDQSGADYRGFRLTLDANNQLTVEMKFGADSNYITAFSADLSAYDRPDTFKIGFTGATGGSTEIHEIRNLEVTMTPWQSGAYEWDNGAGTTTWGNTPGNNNSNWYNVDPTKDNKTPMPNADILFGNKPSDNQTVTLGTNTQVNSLTFDAGINYTLNGSSTLTLGNTVAAGLPSINVNDYNGAQGQHHINVVLNVVEELRINNYSFSTLCINDTLITNGNEIDVNGWGTTNFNGDITGSGDLHKKGAGMVTLNNNNADGGTPWTGNIRIDDGMVVVTADGALGGSVNSTNNQSRSAGNTTIRLSDANAAAAGVKVGQLVTGTNIPAGTYITGISSSGGNTTITLSQALTGSLSNGATVAFAGTTTVNSGGTLAFRAPNATGGFNYTTTESVTISGNGIHRGSEGHVGAIYNDGGNNSFAGRITLAADSALGSRDGVLTLSGVIGQAGGARSLTKMGEGVVSLTGTNTYTGNTIIQNGVLRVTTGSLPGGYDTSNTGNDYGAVNLAGGVLELASNTTFTRRLGTGEEQIFWSGDGGFSAHGGNRTVSLTNSSGTANGTLTWNSGSFVPTNNALLLSSDYSNATVTLTNAIALGNQVREVRVANGSAAVDGVLSGVLSGSGGGINKTGEGTLWLNANNTYTGATRISGGALRVDQTNRIDGSNLQLNGGVLELGFDFNRSLGAGTSAVQWTGDGGFAAYSANRTVTLGSGNRTWGQSNFVGNNNRLIFGSTSANRTVTLTNNLGLGTSGTRTIHTVRGTDSSRASGALSGVVSGSAGLAVTGNGRLDLTGNNTHTGAVTVTGAELRLSGSGDLAQSSGLAIRQGGRLTLDNTSTVGSNRIGNVGVALDGGSLNLIGRNTNSGSNRNITESVGAITLAGGANTIDLTRTNSSAYIRLSGTSLSRDDGTTVNFTNTGGTLGGTGTYDSRVTFGTAPTLTSNVLGYATVNGAAFAGYNATYGITAVAGTNTAQNSWTSSINATPTSDQTLTNNRTVGSLSLGSSIDVNLGSRTLTINSGGLLSTGTTKSVISNGTLRGGTTADELIAHVYGSGGLEISATIANNGDPAALTKTGDGVLTLLGATANTFTGDVRVNDGTLALAKGDGVTAINGDIYVGDGRGTDILRLDANEQIANTADVTLHGGEYGETILQFNGSGGVGLSETFSNLVIDGVAIIDFAGGNVCDANFLYLDDLLMSTPDSLLYIRNWIDYTDFLLVRNDADIGSVLSQIHFEGYGNGAFWQSYDNAYSRITPVPEPSTYGALLVGASLAFYFWRKRRAGASAER